MITTSCIENKICFKVFSFNKCEDKHSKYIKEMREFLLKNLHHRPYNSNYSIVNCFENIRGDDRDKIFKDIFSVQFTTACWMINYESIKGEKKWNMFSKIFIKHNIDRILSDNVYIVVISKAIVIFDEVNFNNFKDGKIPSQWGN